MSSQLGISGLAGLIMGAQVPPGAEGFRPLYEPVFTQVAAPEEGQQPQEEVYPFGNVFYKAECMAHTNEGRSYLRVGLARCGHAHGRAILQATCNPSPRHGTHSEAFVEHRESSSKASRPGASSAGPKGNRQ
jgi:hypothetical protein